MNYFEGGGPWVTCALDIYCFSHGGCITNVLMFECCDYGSLVFEGATIASLDINTFTNNLCEANSRKLRTLGTTKLVFDVIQYPNITSKLNLFYVGSTTCFFFYLPQIWIYIL